jgi:hydrogenase nickel incorporation protein HypB
MVNPWEGTSRSKIRTCSVPPVVILNKVDLLPHLDFSVALAIANVRQVNPDTILEVSARTGGGIEERYSWIRSQVVAARQFALIERGVRPGAP